MKLRNGHYSITLKGTHTDIILKAYNGLLKLPNGRYISEKTLLEHYSTPKEIKAVKSNYNIHWIYAGKIKEVIQINAPYAVCVWKIGQIKSNYILGKLIIVRSL